MQTANCANDTTGAVEWLSRRGDARNEQQALEYVNERKGKKRRELPRFPQEHKVNVYEDRGEKYGGTVTRTPEQEAVLETKLPADSTDKRVVRRRAALAAALGYEYERMKWLAGYSINYRVGNDGVPVPKDAPFILARV